MLGRIMWWNDQKDYGIILVDGGSDVGERYFLLRSRIIKCPEVITSGMYVKFPDYLNAKRPDLLPVAVRVVVSRTPLVEFSSSVVALLSGAAQKDGNGGGL
jgi:hypothetical protein